MKFFFGTEFSERGPNYPITLISIGIVDERGGSLYLVSADFREEDCSEWVKANVLPHIAGAQRLPLGDIAILVREWVDVQCDGAKPEFWAYYAAYDWVVLAQMFGTMMDLPEGWPMYCRDIKQLCDSLGSPELPKQSETEHDALADARWNKQAYDFLAASTPEAAGRSDDEVAEDQKRVDELMVYAWITNGILLHNPHQMARIVREIREEGIAGVMSIRCMEHRAIPQLNHCEASGAECGACVAMGQTPAPPSGEQDAVKE